SKKQSIRPGKGCFWFFTPRRKPRMELYTVNTGFFKLDGGAMFGVVPKVLWSRTNPSDEKNLCNWAMRSLLVVDGERIVLIDNGIGDKQDAKFLSLYYLHGDDTLSRSLHRLGVN